MAITKDIEGKPKLSDQVQRIVWLLAHFTALAEERIEEKKASERINWREYGTVLLITLVSLLVAIILPDAIQEENVPVLPWLLKAVGLIVITAFPASVLLLIGVSISNIRRWIRGSSVSVDTSLGRLSALISYASQTLEHHALHPMDQLMLRVQLAESEDVLKRGMEHASVTSEHDLPEEKEFYDALEF